MIREWDEIISRFDAIKDHRPKATKKLNELGEILASAYKKDPAKADEMWQYLVNLNVSDNTENAKFYIAQIFNKLTNQLEPEEATDFVALTPERVQLMLLYGYDGGTLWHCLSTLIIGFLKIGNVQNCMITLEFFFEKFGGLYSNHESVFSAVSRSIRDANELNRAEPCYKETIQEFFNELLELDNDKINAYVRVSLVLHDYKDASDVGELIDLATEYKFSTEFMGLLWKFHEEMSVDTFKDYWVSYLENMDEEDYPPFISFQEDNGDDDDTDYYEEPKYEGSKMQYYVDIMKDNDEILPHYFNSVSDVVDCIVYIWIVDGDWDRFTRYIAQLLLNASDERYEYSNVKRLMDCYLNAYFHSDYIYTTDGYGRKNKIITEENLVQAHSALAAISAITVGCPLHDEFHETIKAFMQKSSGNLDALKEAGFDEELEERSPEHRFKDYVQNFLQSGEREHNIHNGEYRRICDAIRDEIRDCDYDEQIDQQVERDYVHALDDDIAKFYFLHCSRASNEKADLIVACIKKDNLARAIELVDLLATTASYDDFSEHNSWAFDMKRVAELVAEAFTKGGRFSWRNQDVTEVQAQTAYELIERIIPYLNAEDADSVRIQLMKLIPEKADNEQYIQGLMQDVEVYTTFPKPRGKGNAPNINRMSAKIGESFEILARMGRLDVISQILNKFVAVKDILKPVAYSTWMHMVYSSLESDDIYKLYKMNKEVFAAWLEEKLHEHEIIDFTEKLCEHCSYEEYLEFRDMVISRHGFVEGLDDCFDSKSEYEDNDLDEDEYFDDDEDDDEIGSFAIDLDDPDIEEMVRQSLEYDGSDDTLSEEDDTFEDITFFDDDNFRLDFCGLEFNGNALCFEFWCSNRSIDDITLFARDIRINGETVSRFEVIGNIESFDSDFIMLTINEFGCNDYSNINTFDFSVEIDDELSGELVCSGNIHVSCNTTDKTFSVQIEDASDTVLDDEEDDDVIFDETNEEFEDITFYNENLIRIDFCGLTFEDDTLAIKFWAANNRDEVINLFAKDITINGIHRENFSSFATMNPDEYDYYYFVVSDDFGVAYDDITSIALSIELNDSECYGLFETPIMHIECDTDSEEFSVNIPGVGSYGMAQANKPSSNINLSAVLGNRSDDIDQSDIDEFNRLFEAYKGIMDA